MQVANFLIERLENAGVKTVFGLPGDYVSGLYKKLWANENIEVVNNIDENYSGFAADAYARVKGIGCVVVTYNVGATKLINSVQCAYAERSPLIVISGAPGMDERDEGILLHHMVGNFNSQKNLFDHITCASEVLSDPATAGYQIDRAFEYLHHYKRPIYIELPRDVAKKSISYDVYRQGTPTAPKTDKENLQEAIKEVYEWLKESKRPAILAGVEIARYGLGEELVSFARRTNIPIATTLLSKSTVDERDPLFAGIYSGASSKEDTRIIIEESDCLLMFGVMLTDMTLCFKPAKFDKRQVVSVNLEGLKIKNHTFKNVQFSDFCKSLFDLNIESKQILVDIPKRKNASFEPVDAKITTKRVFQKIDSILDDNMAIIADVGDSLFGAGDLTVHQKNLFLSPAFYASMGFAIPAALGVKMAMPDVRPIVILGDGAFQMSFSELSTMIKRKMNPIVFVLNNGGFASERYLQVGDYHLHSWDYHRIGEIFKGGDGCLVATEKELEEAVKTALDSKTVFVINIQLDSKDFSEGLKRMMEARKDA